MKKISIFLVVVMISISFTAYCENKNIVDFENLNSLIVDFENLNLLSNTELLDYDSMIEVEKANRNLSNPLLEGDYLVGRDIPSGYYKINCFRSEKSNSRVFNFYLYLRVYIDEEKKIECEKLMAEEKLNASNIKNYTTFHGSWVDTATGINLYLEDGNILYVHGAQTNGTTFIEKSSPLFMD